MQLSHSAKVKLENAGAVLKEELRHAKPDSIIGFSGDKAVNIYLDSGDRGIVTGVLEKVGIDHSDGQLTVLGALGMAIYKPQELEAGKLAALLEEPLVQSVEQERVMGVSR